MRKFTRAWTRAYSLRFAWRSIRDITLPLSNDKTGKTAINSFNPSFPVTVHWLYGQFTKEKTCSRLYTPSLHSLNGQDSVTSVVLPINSKVSWIITEFLLLSEMSVINRNKCGFYATFAFCFEANDLCDDLCNFVITVCKTIIIP